VSTRFQWSGLDELKRDLRNLPVELTDEGGAIIESEAGAARNDIVAAYPSRTGNLRKGVKVQRVDRGRFGAAAIVRNSAPHASIFEHGTQARHTDLGANRGSMPPGHVFIPAMIRARRRMYNRLRSILIAHGLSVSGNA